MIITPRQPVEFRCKAISFPASSPPTPAKRCLHTPVWVRLNGARMGRKGRGSRKGRRADCVSERAGRAAGAPVPARGVEGALAVVEAKGAGRWGGPGLGVLRGPERGSQWIPPEHNPPHGQRNGL